ncbi:RNA-dependent ATPase [Martiniozyma asiatica (nom. inval.)]|nr:RNA-dependent ATPase [Martiniozyma asiatica]
MDIFKVLSRGASIRRSKDVQADFSNHFNEKLNKKKTRDDKSVQEKQIEKEIDFFHSKQHKIIKKVEENISSEDESENLAENESKDEDEIPNKITTAEQAIALRENNKTKITGSDVPLPIGSFEDLVSRFKFSKQLLENLIFNDFTEPTAIQSEAIPITLFDRDLIACAPTGSGKTLAFLIPMIQQILNAKFGKGKKEREEKKNDSDKALRGLIISPTKELSNQIYLELEKLTLKLGLTVGFLNKANAAKLRNKQIQSDKFDILVSTPLRLIDLLKNESIDLSKVTQLVFDEADSLFESNFLQQTDAILAALTSPNLRKSIFSATITSHVEELAHGIMRDAVRIIVGHKEAANSNIEQKLIFCGDEHGKLVAIRDMISGGEFKPPVIIFLQSIQRAKALYSELLYDGLNVDVIHAERTQHQRDEAIQRFRSGELWCLITTDVLARGVDFKGINLVINYDVPNSAQAYVHRIGRTGRNGRKGRAVTFYTNADLELVKNVVNVIKASKQFEGIPEWMRADGALSKLSKMRKRQLKKQQIEREKISTLPNLDKKKRRQRKEMIAASKKRKTETQE